MHNNNRLKTKGARNVTKKESAKQRGTQKDSETVTQCRRACISLSQSFAKYLSAKFYCRCREVLKRVLDDHSIYQNSCSLRITDRFRGKCTGFHACLMELSRLQTRSLYGTTCNTSAEHKRQKNSQQVRQQTVTVQQARTLNFTTTSSVSAPTVPPGQD